MKYFGRRRVRVVNSKAISFVFKSVLFLTALYLCVVDLPKLQVAYASPYTNIDVDTAYNMITSGLYPDLVVLDVRTQTEYDGGHICGAVLIPVSELEARIGELAGHENHEIIVYCKSGGRSATASGILDSHGFTKVYNMLGGISAWKSAGYPVGIVCAPVASFTWVPSTPKIGELVTFDASNSTPNGGTITEYEWDFGDGENGTGQIVTHTYMSADTYTVTLNVTDSEGLWDTEQRGIQVVQPCGPKAEFTAIPDAAPTGESIKFDASASLPGWNGTHTMPITEYRWNFGGGVNMTTSTPILYYSFIGSGIYYATLTVYAPGATPETDSTTQEVTITAIPVGGYSVPIKGYTAEKPLTLYLALVAILTTVCTMIKRKTHRRTKQS